MDNISIPYKIIIQHYYQNKKTINKLYICQQSEISINTNLENLKEALSFDFEDFDVALNEGFSLKENIQFFDNWIAGQYKE